jgi:hypothetical protein
VLKSKLKSLSSDDAQGKVQHASLVGLQRGERGSRHRDDPNVVVLQVDGEAVEAIGDRRARRAAARVSPNIKW